MAQQMAQQQQEFMNRLMQNQAAAPAYEEAAPSSDDAMWMDASDEIVSLEELYGRMDDDAKRCYYEIGSYIMNKSGITQNDGKYAVLFRYRGKTMFKLCIKDNAPVFYYATDNGGRSEVRIADASSLQVAKDMVDLRIIKAGN